MPTKTRERNRMQDWSDLCDELQKALPHLSGLWNREAEFVELRVKMRNDGTCLSIAKGYGPDGGPRVCFGTGYGCVAALLAINDTIGAGHWKPDKPWKPGNGSS